MLRNFNYRPGVASYLIREDKRLCVRVCVGGGGGGGGVMLGFVSVFVMDLYRLFLGFFFLLAFFIFVF